DEVLRCAFQGHRELLRVRSAGTAARRHGPISGACASPPLPAPTLQIGKSALSASSAGAGPRTRRAMWDRRPHRAGAAGGARTAPPERRGNAGGTARAGDYRNATAEWPGGTGEVPADRAAGPPRERGAAPPASAAAPGEGFPASTEHDFHDEEHGNETANPHVVPGSDADSPGRRGEPGGSAGPGRPAQA